MQTITYRPKYNHTPHKNLHQRLEEKAFDYSDPKNPVRKEINKNIGSFDLTVSIEEDKQTLSLLNTPGLISFLCLLKVNNKVIGSGRGSSLISQNNRYVERVVRYAFGSSILDAVAKTVKTSDVLYPNKKEGVPFSIEDLNIKETEMITSNQKRYLTELIYSNITDEEQKAKWESNLEDFTKAEASEAISNFKS